MLSLIGAYDTTFGWYRLSGEVRNDAAVTIMKVQPIGTLYDAQDHVLGCFFDYVDSTDLDAGQTSPFEILFSGRDFADVDHYRIQVNGD